MPSLFPGKDPYLEEESLWPWFQHQFAITLHLIISTVLGAQYKAEIRQRCFRDGHQDHGEEYVTIHAESNGQLVTLLDIVSPVDKLTEAGRAACQATRRAAQSSAANIVEIDLVLRGAPIVEYSREGLPSWDYAVTVTRSAQPVRHEIYTGMLEKRLPRFRVPLAAVDRDFVVDLQEAFSRTYDACGFESRIDYRQDPSVPLSVEVRGRLAQMLSARF